MSNSHTETHVVELKLRSAGKLIINSERIALLEAVIEFKSITVAAQKLGYSYKTAWDAVDGLNRLLPSPAFIAQTGGVSGGNTAVTDVGRNFIEGWRALEKYNADRILELIDHDCNKNDTAPDFQLIDVKTL